MKLSAQSQTSIISSLKKSFERYASSEEKHTVTDFYLQPQMGTGELLIFNDDDELLADAVVKEWEDINPEDFYIRCEMVLKSALNQLRDAGELALLHIVKPYSFVLVDNNKETVSELLLMDEDETMFISDELLKGLDEELNAFLKDLLEN